MNVAIAPYQHEHAEITVELEPGEDAESAFKVARDAARKALGIDVTPDQILAAKEVLRKAKRVPRPDPCDGLDRL